MSEDTINEIRTAAVTATHMCVPFNRVLANRPHLIIQCTSLPRRLAEPECRPEWGLVRDKLLEGVPYRGNLSSFGYDVP